MTHEQELLKSAVSEMRSLRTENRVQAARLDMFDKMMMLFETAPAYRGMCMGEDLVWKIEQHLDGKSNKPEGQIKGSADN